MKMIVNQSAVLMNRLDTIELVDAAGSTATLERGCVWITMDGDRRDIVLGAGDSWTVERNGHTLVQAEAPALLRITGPVANDPAPPRWTERIGSAAMQLWRAFERKSAPYY